MEQHCTLLQRIKNHLWMKIRSQITILVEIQPQFRPKQSHHIVTGLLPPHVPHLNVDGVLASRVLGKHFKVLLVRLGKPSDREGVPIREHELHRGGIGVHL